MLIRREPDPPNFVVESADREQAVLAEGERGRLGVEPAELNPHIRVEHRPDRRGRGLSARGQASTVGTETDVGNAFRRPQDGDLTVGGRIQKFHGRVAKSDDREHRPLGAESHHRREILGGTQARQEGLLLNVPQADIPPSGGCEQVIRPDRDRGERRLSINLSEEISAGSGKDGDERAQPRSHRDRLAVRSDGDQRVPLISAPDHSRGPPRLVGFPPAVPE